MGITEGGVARTGGRRAEFSRSRSSHQVGKNNRPGRRIVTPLTRTSTFNLCPWSNCTCEFRSLGKGCGLVRSSQVVLFRRKYSSEWNVKDKRWQIHNSSLFNLTREGKFESWSQNPSLIWVTFAVTYSEWKSKRFFRLSPFLTLLLFSCFAEGYPRVFPSQTTFSSPFYLFSRCPSNVRCCFNRQGMILAQLCVYAGFCAVYLVEARRARMVYGATRVTGARVACYHAGKSLFLLPFLNADTRIRARGTKIIEGHEKYLFRLPTELGMKKRRNGCRFEQTKQDNLMKTKEKRCIESDNSEIW